MRELRKRIVTLIIVLAVVISTLAQVPAQTAKAANDVTVYYRTHIQKYGWEGVAGQTATWKQDGEMSGTSGESKRLEGIEIVVEGNSNLEIQYTTHCQNYGWLPWSADGEMNGTEGESKRLEAIKIQLTGTDSLKYDVYYRVHAQNYGWLGWAKNGQASGTAGLSKRLEGIQIVVVPAGQTVPDVMDGISPDYKEPYISKSGQTDEYVSGNGVSNVSYKTHVQTFGWQGWKYNGDISGTSGQSKRLEGINIRLTNKQVDGGITYRTHVQSYGWQNWVCDGAMAGTSGESKRLESIQIYLTGDMAKHYDVYYRVHAQTYGWLGWVKNGEPAGTAGYSKRLEAIQIVLVGKNAGNPGNVGGIESVTESGFEYTSVSQIPENPYVEPDEDGQGGDSGSGSAGDTDSGSSGSTNSGSTGDTDSGSSGNTNSGGAGGNSSTEEPEIDITDYTYKVIPLTDDVCSYFYVETDNPDPDSFIFIDEDNSSITKYLAQDYEAWFDNASEFADVKYTDSDTLRVNGGYIFKCDLTDGGTIRLYEYSRYGKGDATDITVTLPEIKSEEQYLIDTYTDDTMTFWEKMDAIDSGLNGICMYSGTYVLGDLKKSTSSPYYGLSNSPHVDQTFYIQDPYYREDNKKMLVTYLYPYIMDSLGYPSMLGKVAKRLDSSVDYSWNSDYHWLIDVTYNGETRSYGGAGRLSSQGINQDMVKYWYTFDGTYGDASATTSWEGLWNMHLDYSDMEVPEEELDLTELTWNDVRSTVGTDGSYVKLYIIASIWGAGGDGYTFLYDKGTSNIGYFNNVWYDGRYFNKYEYFEKGTTFEDETASKANIVIKNPIIRFPEAPEGKTIRYNRKDINTLGKYDYETGVWNDFVCYNYDADTQTWVATLYLGSQYWDSTNREYTDIDDETFKADCTLTMEEVKAMGIDRNANVDPSSYYNYNMEVEPGTYETN